MSSQSDSSSRSFIEPIALTEGQSMADVQAALTATSGFQRFVSAEDTYAHARFVTPTVGFVDDVEVLLLDDTLHVRSASRLGIGDGDVNRRRVEDLRQLVRAAY